MLKQVSPFRDLRIHGYLLLPEAFRSLSRLSSALSAKASTLCSFLLNQLLMYSVTPASFWLVLFSHSSNGCCLVVSFFGHVFPHNPSDVFEGPSGAFSFLFPLWVPSFDIVFNMWFSRYVLFLLISKRNIRVWILPPVGLSGLEPPTSRLSGVRSNRLSYKPFSNPAPTCSPISSPI